MDKLPSKRAALAVATLSSFLPPFTGSSINIALPSIGAEFSADALMLNWVASSYLLSAAIFLVPFGKIADIFGRKKIFLCGIAVFTAASTLCAFSPDLNWLIAFRILQGFGSSMVFGTSVAMLTSIFPPGERGKAIGINSTAVYLGLSAGPIIGGFLTQHLGWRSIFMLMAPIGMAAIVLTMIKIRTEWAESKGEKFDFAGSVIYSLSLASLMYGFSKVPDTTGIWLIVAGAALLAVFTIWELRISVPVLDLKLFRNNSVFAFSNLAAFINYSATFAVGFLLSLYLQYVKGMDPQYAGIVLVSQPVVMAFFSPYAGRLSDRTEPRIVASAGMALTLAGFIFLCFISEDTALCSIIASLVLFGLGFALFASPNTNAVMSSVDKKYYGVSAAVIGTMRLTGQMFSMGISMLVFAVMIGKTRISQGNFHDFISSLRVVVILFSFLSFIGIFASLARGRLR